MIDTKKARALRAKGTAGRWEVFRDQRGYSVATERDECCLAGDWEEAEDDAELIAYAANSLAPMADEIDRLRAALRECRDVLTQEEQAARGQGQGFRRSRINAAITYANTLLGDSK